MSLPDLAFVKRHVAIRQIARELGLQVRGNSARCWREGNHQNGDLSPSVSFHRNRYKCFVCDQRGGSNVDLVMSVLGCDLPQAIAWIERCHPVPRIDPEERRRWRPTRAGVGGYMWDVVVRSGLLAALPKNGGRVLGVLCGYAEPDTGTCEISYAGIMHYAGIRSRKIVSSELKLLRALGLLHWTRADAPGGFRAPNCYKLCLDASTCSEAVRALSTFPQRQRRRRCKTPNFAEKDAPVYLGTYFRSPMRGTTGDFDGSPHGGNRESVTGTENTVAPRSSMWKTTEGADFLRQLKT